MLFIHLAKEVNQNSAVHELKCFGINGDMFGLWHGIGKSDYMTNLCIYKKWIKSETSHGKNGERGYVSKNPRISLEKFVF